MAENTIVIFASDHGEMLGDHGMFQKSCAYESALRVPLIAAGPGIQTGVVSSALVELSDLNPTICELAGLPRQVDIDARSIVPILQGEAQNHRDSTVTSMHNFRAIRTRTHKFIENFNDRDELYDLQADPQEQHNLIDGQPELARVLRGQMAARMQEGKGLR